MADKFESDLDRLLDKFDSQARARDQKREQHKAEEDAFDKEFAALRRDVIRPVLETLATRLKQRGHDFEITEEGRGTDSQGRSRDASIQIRIFPGDMKASRGSEYPMFGFVAVPYKKSVIVHGSNMTPLSGGSAGPRGEYSIKQVTKDLVAQEFIKLFAEVVNK